MASFVAEQRQVDRVGHGLIAGVVRMHVVAAGGRRQQARRLLGSRRTLSKSLTPS